VAFDGRESVQLLGVSSSALFLSGSVPNSYDILNQNFDFEATKTLILHAWSFFSGGLTYQTYAVKKYFS
jgi:hypothetical protein